MEEGGLAAAATISWGTAVIWAVECQTLDLRLTWKVLAPRKLIEFSAAVAADEL